jgi:hypothetical protein
MKERRIMRMSSKFQMLFAIVVLVATTLTLTGCPSTVKTADQIQSERQEKVTSEGVAQVGLPNIANFREMKLAKAIQEMRDQEISTYTYIFVPMTGKLKFMGNSVGFPLPYATQLTSPQKLQRNVASSPGEGSPYHIEYNIMPQSEPNGLFSPEAAEGTWILMKNPNKDEVKPVYFEERIIVSVFELSTE